MKIDTTISDSPQLCSILSEHSEVVSRLDELGLEPHALIEVAAKACLQRANATPFHAANAPGTYSYQEGTFALRDLHVGKNGWKKERPNGVEAIWNPNTNIRVVFANVDTCCNPEYDPKPKSDKGAGAERTCQPNLFETLPKLYKPENSLGLTFYLMVDDCGRVELSRPIIRRKTFSEFPERIFLRKHPEDETFAKLPLDDDDAVVDFDPVVAPKLVKV